MPLAVVVVDSLAVAAWLRWLAAVAPGYRPPATSAVLAAGVGAVIVGRVLARLDPRRARLAAPLTAGVAVLMVVRFTLVPLAPATDTAWLWRYGRELYEGLGTFGGASVATGATLLVWWRGLRYASNIVDSRQAKRTVATAVLALAGLAVTAHFTYPVSITPFVAAGAVAGLGAMAFARLDAAAMAAGRRGGPGGGWLLLTAGAIGVVLALALMLSAVVSLELAGKAVTALEPLAKVVARILLLGLVVLLDGVAALAAHLGRLLHLDTADWAAQFQLMQRQIVEQPPYDSEVVPGTTAPWAVALLRLGLLAAVVGLAAVWLSRAAARYTRGAVAEEGVEGELALSRARIVADAAALARSVAAGARSAVRRLGRGEGQGVRGAYRSFLSAMAAAGWVRPPSATPFEFEAIGRQVVPEEGPAVVDLTAAYVRARYGVAPAGGDVAGRARAAWRRIRSALEAREV